MNEFKLFVLGETSPDPDEWGRSGATTTLVVARNAEEAKTLCDVNWNPTEVRLDRPMHLFERYASDGL